MERRPEIGLVSTGIAIEDEHQRLTGVRARGPSGKPVVRKPLGGLISPPVAHAASMVRMETAKQYRYNPGLYRSEDADFLLKVLLEHQYSMLHEVLYAYREYLSVTRFDVLEAYRYRMLMFWTFRRQFPLASVGRSMMSAIKWGLYSAAFATGHAGDLISRRSVAPSGDDFRLYTDARNCVASFYRSYFDEKVRFAVPSKVKM